MKKLFISAVSILVLVMSFGVHSVSAATTPVTGFAWSSNIGWIQFDTGVAQPVTVDTTSGNFAGYAWSSNIGWIDFSGANVNISTGAVTGWAQALSADNNGWDGKIELSGTNHATGDVSGNSGVTMKTATGAFVGYAWGGSVVGWVQFNPTLVGGGAPGGVCAGCSGGGVAPVVAGNCSAITPVANLAPNTSVTFQANPTSGTAPYQYSWSGAASTTVNQFTVIYPASGVGPAVHIGDSAAPVKGYSVSMACPSVTVLQPLGASNTHINKGTSPSLPTFTSINVNQNTVTSFNVSWNITLVSGSSCAASIGNDPNLANWNTGWKTVVLNSGNGTDNGDGTMTWVGNTGASLSTPLSGLNIGSYPFTLTCGSQTTSALLRITTTSLNEI